MIFDRITPEQAVDYLNELNRLDPVAMAKLLSFPAKVVCNPQLGAHHTSCQVGSEMDGNLYVGMLGVINGMFGIQASMPSSLAMAPSLRWSSLMGRSTSSFSRRALCPPSVATRVLASPRFPSTSSAPSAILRRMTTTGALVNAAGVAPSSVGRPSQWGGECPSNWDSFTSALFVAYNERKTVQPQSRGSS